MIRQGGALAATLGFSLPLFDDVQFTYPTATTVSCTFWNVGVHLATIVLTYTDSTLTSLTRAQRTF